jgi:hypothetical protein
MIRRRRFDLDVGPFDQNIGRFDLHLASAGEHIPRATALERSSDLLDGQVVVNNSR